VQRKADFDPSGRYRYRLIRQWSAADARVAFVLLNPSTADAAVDDPTIRRCIQFARAWRFGSLAVVNLFAWRSPDPRALKRTPTPVGPDNDQWILRTVAECESVVVAWGNAGRLHKRDADVLSLLRTASCQPHCLGRTLSRAPRHPLYLRRDVQREPFVLE